MITGDWNELLAMADNNVCAADGGRLNVAWDDKAALHYLRCGACGATKGIKRVMSLTEEHKAGNLPDGPIKDNVEKGAAKRQAKKPLSPWVVTMGGVPATDLGTGELLNLETVQTLAYYARKYGLDPARGHVCLMYGKPYFTLDGYLYHAHETNVPYSMASFPMSTQERKDYQVGDGDHAWLCEITKLLSGSKFTGVGIVTQEEMTAMSKKNPTQLASPVVAKHPWQLAQKRAEWQTLRRAFPIGENPQGEEK